MLTSKVGDGGLGCTVGHFSPRRHIIRDTYAPSAGDDAMSILVHLLLESYTVYLASVIQINAVLELYLFQT